MIPSRCLAYGIIVLLAFVLVSARWAEAEVPDDPGYSSQWGMNNTGQNVGGVTGVAGYDAGAEKAWDTVTNASTVVVAVIDSGVDYTHPDLAANMWHNPGEIPANGIDDDSNGIIDDYYGAAFTATSSSGDPLETTDPHGTRVAGVVGAVGDNGLGLAGMAWDVDIMALKVDGTTASLVSAIDYILDMKSRGVNVAAACASLGAPGGRDSDLGDKIDGLGKAGTVWAASAGNDALDNDSSGAKEYPASFDTPTLVSVGAMNATGWLANFSSFGRRSVDMVAPGVNINSTMPGSSYGLDDGTSFSAPFVAGTVALLAARYPNDTVYQRLSRLLSTVNKASAFSSNTAFGGYLSAANALNASSPLTPFTANSTAAEGMVFGKAFTLEGVNFGSVNGSVVFGTLAANTPSAPLVSWNGTRVSATVPSGAGRYVMVADADGALSNALEFTAWQGVADMPQYHTDGCAASWGGLLYVAGGRTSNSTSTSAFHVYDPKNDVWTGKAEMPDARAFCSAVALNRRIMCFGGTLLPSGVYANTMLRYDIASNGWDNMDIGLPYRNATAATVVGDSVYIVGGMDPTGTATKEVYKYNATAESLEHVCDLAVARYGHKAVTVGEDVLVFGGWTSPGNLATTMETINKSYRTASNSTPLRVFMNGGFTNGQAVYFVTGMENYNSTRDTQEPFFYSYDPATATWTNGSGSINLPMDYRASAAVAYMPGRGAYAAGGFSDLGGNESQLTGVEFLALADAVEVNTNRTGSNASVTVTSFQTLDLTSAEIVNSYPGLPTGARKFADAVTFTAKVEPHGALVTFRYAVSAASTIAAGDLRLFKLDDVTNGTGAFEYASDTTAANTRNWWMEDSNGTFMYSSDTLYANETYYVNFVLRDGDGWDLSGVGGVIRDPQALMYNATSGGGGGGDKKKHWWQFGCLSNPEASFSWEWLMVLAGLPVAMLVRRKFPPRS